LRDPEPLCFDWLRHRINPSRKRRTTVARKMIVTLTDDLDDTEIPEGGGETVVFSLDGKVYELDLKHDNAKKMRDTMGQYVSRARLSNLGHEKRKGARPTAASIGRTDRNESKTIRAWGRAQGMTVPDRGRIPGEVLARWEALSGTEKALAQQAAAGAVEQMKLDTAETGGKAPANTSPPEFSSASTQAKGTKATTKADTPKAEQKQPANA
jgi:hypothetical protein